MKKSPLALIAKMLPALEEVACLSEFGNTEKYSEDSWLNWESSEEAEIFTNKRMHSLARHVMQGMRDKTSRDTESGMLHLAAAAWNALAIVTLILKYDLENKSNKNLMQGIPADSVYRKFEGYRKTAQELFDNDTKNNIGKLIDGKA